MFAQLCSPTAWANARNGSPRISGSCFFGVGDALRPMVCPTRCRSAPFVVLLAVPWRRILSYASLPCRRNGLRAWRPARLLLGDVWLSSSSCFCYVLSHRHGRSWCVFLGQQCYANVVAKAHFVGGGVRERVPRRDLREHPGAHHEICFSNSRAATSAVGGGGLTAIS